MIFDQFNIPSGPVLGVHHKARLSSWLYRFRADPGMAMCGMSATLPVLAPEHMFQQHTFGCGTPLFLILLHSGLAAFGFVLVPYGSDAKDILKRRTLYTAGNIPLQPRD